MEKNKLLKSELTFHLVVVISLVILSVFFLVLRARSFDKNYPNPIPLTDSKNIYIESQ